MDEALSIASQADVIVAAVGESAEMSGESSSRSNIEIPQAQKDLLKALMKTGKPVVLVLFTGRPLALKWENENVPVMNRSGADALLRFRMMPKPAGFRDIASAARLHSDRHPHKATHSYHDVFALIVKG